ncbi:hypothetical protein ACTPEM_25620, partial [Clostridioides difficile]
FRWLLLPDELDGKSFEISAKNLGVQVYCAERFSVGNSTVPKANTATSVLHFSKILIDNKLSKKTGFKVGSEVYYLHRLRYIDNI